MLYGAGCAVLILLFFFHGWRRPVLIAGAVPVALLLAVLGFNLGGANNRRSFAGRPHPRYRPDDRQQYHRT